VIVNCWSYVILIVAVRFFWDTVCSRLPVLSLTNMPGYLVLVPWFKFNLRGRCIGRHEFSSSSCPPLPPALRVVRGSNFLDPTQPDPQVKWSNPTRPRINMKLWTRPSPTHARLSVFPSAAESFSLSTKWLFNSDANIIVSRASAFCPNDASSIDR